MTQHSIVFIVLDTVRRDRLSVYNDDIEFTDHLDAFADEAAVYENAVAQAPWTLPSHASMFTGAYPWEHGATQQNLYLETDSDLLAERFQDAGYRTMLASYNVYLSSDFGIVDGFDTVENFGADLVPDVVQRLWNRIIVSNRFAWLKRHINRAANRLFHSRFNEVANPAAVVDRSRAFIADAAADDANFFLFVNFMEAHEPYFPSESYRDRHAPDVAPDEIEQDPGRIISSGEGAYDALSTLYDASVDELDDAVGDLLAVIDDLDDEPIVIICADHGQLLGEDGMYGHQFSVAEELVHVPLLVRGPGIDAGRTAEQLELRQLYDAIPRWAGLTVAEPPVETADIALGGYAFPDLASKTLTAAARERYYQQLRFGRRNGKKLTETTRSAGDPEQETIDLVTGTTVAPDDALVDAVTDIGTAEAGTSIAEKDEQVKDRLEDLGYM